MKFRDRFKNLEEKVKTNQESDVSSNAEKELIKNKIKIRSKIETKFGTEFILAKKYKIDEIEQALKGFKFKIDDLSVFVEK